MALVLVGAVAAGGCFHRSVPVGVRVVDAETGEPIPRARVTATYYWNSRLPYPIGSPLPARARSGADGVARLRVLDYSASGSTSVAASAAGYLGEEWLPQDALAAALHRPPPAGAAAATPAAPAPVIRLYAAPAATVEIVVPAGYRGPVKVSRFGKGGMSPAPRPGQRLFRFEFVPGSVVQIPTSGVLFYDYAVRAAYPDGQVIDPLAWDRTKPRDEVRLRFVAGDADGTDLYVVGTEADASPVRKAVWPDDDLNQAAYDSYQ